MNIQALLKRSSGFLVILLGLLFGAPLVQAAGFGGDSKLPINGNSSFGTVKTTDVNTFIYTTGTTILNIVLLLVAILAVFFLILYGFQYLTAGGDPEKAKKARGGIINAIIGIIIIASAFYIVDFALQGSSIFSGLTKSSSTGTSPGNIPPQSPN